MEDRANFCPSASTAMTTDRLGCAQLSLERAPGDDSERAVAPRPNQVVSGDRTGTDPVHNHL